jgi:hypothetical protein
MRIRAIALASLVATAAAGTPCAETPVGTFTCDKFVARNANTATENAIIAYPNDNVVSAPACGASDNAKIVDLDNTAAEGWAMCSKALTITGADDAVRLTVKGAAGQTAGLQAWVNSSGTEQASLSVNGEFKPQVYVADVRATSGNATLGYEGIILCSTSGSDAILTLPPAASASGRIYWIKKVDAPADDCVIDGNGAELVDGAATQRLLVQYEAVHVVSDGTAWWIF